MSSWVSGLTRPWTYITINKTKTKISAGLRLSPSIIVELSPPESRLWCLLDNLSESWMSFVDITTIWLAMFVKCCILVCHGWPIPLMATRERDGLEFWKPSLHSEVRLAILFVKVYGLFIDTTRLSYNLALSLQVRLLGSYGIMSCSLRYFPFCSGPYAQSV